MHCPPLPASRKRKREDAKASRGLPHIIENGMVYAYVQENVRGLDMDRYDDDPDYPTGPPRVVRYSTTLLALERRAAAETRGLAGC